MTADDDIEFTENVELEDNDEDFRAAIELLTARCKNAGILITEKYNEEIGKYYHLEIPNGREKRQITIFTGEECRSLLSIRFEKYIF
jgi:hypothetical protein